MATTSFVFYSFFIGVSILLCQDMTHFIYVCEMVTYVVCDMVAYTKKSSVNIEIIQLSTGRKILAENVIGQYCSSCLNFVLSPHKEDVIDLINLMST